MISREDIEKDFYGELYQLHNSKRLEHLESLGLNLTGKSVLEVGAGIGCHTGFFLNKGCKVVSTDARQENLNILQERYPQVETHVIDLDNDFDLGHNFEIIYCYGTLYHLSNPDKALDNLSLHCKDLMLLETCVSSDLEHGVAKVEEDSGGASQSFHGEGCRPSRRWIFDRLLSLFSYVYSTTTQPNHIEFPIDWHGKSKDLTRAVFVASRIRLENKVLVGELLNKQDRI